MKILVKSTTLTVNTPPIQDAYNFTVLVDGAGVPPFEITYAAGANDATDALKDLQKHLLSLAAGMTARLNAGPL